MPGSCEFQLTGKIFYVVDKPPTPGRPYGSISIGINVGPQYVGTACVEQHGAFVGINYGPQDTQNPGFLKLKSELVKGAEVFVKGDLKSKPAVGDKPPAIYINSKWKMAKVIKPFTEARNKVYFNGEVISIVGNNLKVKYSYVNPKEQDPSKKWKECEYDFMINPDVTVNVGPRDMVFIEGRVFNKHPTKNEKMTWLIADHVF